MREASVLVRVLVSVPAWLVGRVRGAKGGEEGGKGRTNFGT